MPEIDYDELFGLAEDVDESENTQDAADPADETEETEESEGANGQEFADPADNDEDDAEDDPGEGETEGDGNQGDARRVQSKRERAGFAAARREAEERARAALEAEKLRSKNELDGFVRSLGLKDAAGNAIETREAYDAYRARRSEEERRAKLRRIGMDPETLDDVIAHHPAVEAAGRAIAEAEAQKAAARSAETKARLDAEIAEAAKYDPAIKSVEDLRARPYFKEVYGMVGQGYSIVDAVRLATEDERLKAIAEGSAKSAAAKAASKAHLVPMQSRGQGATEVPADFAEQYRVFDPNASAAEIKKMYIAQQKHTQN